MFDPAPIIITTISKVFIIMIIRILVVMRKDLVVSLAGWQPHNANCTLCTWRW